MKRHVPPQVADLRSPVPGRTHVLAVATLCGLLVPLGGGAATAWSQEMKQLNSRTYWLGNNYPSKAMDGFGRGHVHMKMCINDIFAHGDRVFVNGTWDEGHTHIAVFDKAGAFKGVAGQGLHNGWLEGAYAITADDRYVYAGAMIHDADPGAPQGVSAFFVVLRLNHDAKPAPSPGGRTKSVCALVLSREPLVFTGSHPLGYRELNKPAGIAVTGDTLLPHRQKLALNHAIPTSL